MRENWERHSALLSFNNDSLTELIQPIFQGDRVISAQPTTGGLANTNYRLQISGHDRPVLFRVFVRNPDNARKELTINQLVKNRVPVPEFLYFADTNPFTGHPYALVKWITGVRLDTVAQSASLKDIAEIGGAVGSALAGINSFSFEIPGFFNNDLQVAQPISIGRKGFLSFIHECVIEGRGKKHLGAELTDRFWKFIQSQAYFLDEIETAANLVHSDYDGSNILIDRADNEWKVAAVLDWEFAYSGSSLADIGHILRSPFDTKPGFEDNLIDSFVVNGGYLPATWKPISKLLDLLAWVEFLNRPTSGSKVIADAQGVILKTMSNWDRAIA